MDDLGLGCVLAISAVMFLVVGVLLVGVPLAADSELGNDGVLVTVEGFEIEPGSGVTTGGNVLVVVMDALWQFLATLSGLVCGGPALLIGLLTLGAVIGLAMGK